jgi:hypothetical protein
LTSEYRRKLEATVEMPLDADIFRVPPEYNVVQYAALISFLRSSAFFLLGIPVFFLG